MIFLVAHGCWTLPASTFCGVATAVGPGLVGPRVQECHMKKTTVATSQTTPSWGSIHKVVTCTHPDFIILWRGSILFCKVSSRVVLSLSPKPSGTDTLAASRQSRFQKPSAAQALRSSEIDRQFCKILAKSVRKRVVVVELRVSSRCLAPGAIRERNVRRRN